MVRTVTITRAGVSATVSATKTNPDYEIVEDNGAAVKAESTDFIIRSEDYKVGTANAVVEPVAGDTITESLGGKTVIYEVIDLPGVACFKYSDADRIALRVHTKLVSES